MCSRMAPRAVGQRMIGAVVPPPACGLARECDVRPRAGTGADAALPRGTAGRARALVSRRWQHYGKRGALAKSGGNEQLAAVAVEDVLDDGEAKPRAALLAAGG